MPSRSWARRAAAALAALALATAVGCGSDASAPSDDARLTVYVSLPLRGPSADDGLDAADGARLALAQASGRAAGIAVEIDVHDDTAGAKPGWTPSASAANARRATEDSGAIAYIGEFESGATRASLPITNAAGLLQVSPASSATDLVAPFPGSDAVPETQPSGDRTFGRVIPSDVRQARAAAAWVERMGIRRIATLSDGSQFGKQVLIAFGQALRRASVTRRGVGWLFYAGAPDAEPASLTQSIPHLLVTDAELGAAARTQPPGTLATSAALDPTQLPPAGQEFVRDFEHEYGHRPGRYGAYGYEAMAVILDSIERASDPTERSSVVGAFFDTADRDSVLGRYSIDELGETTLDRLAGYRLEAGRPRPVAELRGGP